MLQAQIPVLENKVCKESYANDGKLNHELQFNSAVLCVGHLSGGVDTCHGDSGGPLMLPIHRNGQFPFYAIGVVSYGIGCGEPDKPGVYANVQHFAKWINDTLRE